MDVISRRTTTSSTLNPNAPMFVPLAYRTVEDFSTEWWSLVQSSPWFQDYWLQERFQDPQNDPFSPDINDPALPDDVDALFDDVHYPNNNTQAQQEEEEEEKDFHKELVSMGLLKWRKGEPRHGKFRYRHPWKHYLKIGTLTRQCAYRIDTLNGYLNSEIQTPLNIQSNKVQELCMKMSSESGKALKELAWALKTMTKPCSAASCHITKSRAAANNLKSLLKTSAALLGSEGIHLLDIVPAITVASLLSDVVSYAEQIEKSIHELSSFSHVQFKSAEPTKALQPCNSSASSTNDNVPHLVITIHKLPSQQEIGSKQGAAN